jgi:hypothetical protein
MWIMTTRAKVWISLAIFAVAVAIYYSFSPGGSQQINMRKAEEHIRRIGPQISSDPAFREVRISPFTAQGGSLLVLGAVANESDLQALHTILDDSKPPVEVVFRVRVDPASTAQQ